MVLDGKTNFFLGKKWFWTGKPTFSTFSEENTNKNRVFWETTRPKTKKQVFGFPLSGLVLNRRTICFLGKLDISAQNLFLLGKDRFSCAKPSFFLGKRWLWYGKSIVSKKINKIICLVCGRIVSQRIVFVFFAFS